MKSSSPNAFFFLMRTAWRFAGDSRWRMVLFYAMCITANLFIVLQPVVLANIVNAVQKAGPDLTRNALLWCVAYGSLIVAFWSFHGPARVIEKHLAFTIYRRYVTALYRKVTEMPLKWHQDHHTGDTINRATKAGQALFRFSQEQFITIQLTVRFVGSVIFLGWYCWWVAITAAVLSTGLFIGIRRFDKTLIPLISVVNKREHRLTAGLYDYIGNIITVLTLRLHGSTNREIRHRFMAMRHPFWREVALTEWKWLAVNIILIFMQAGQVGAYIAVTLGTGQPLLIGTVVAIFQYQLMINQIFFQGMMASEQILRQSVDVHSADLIHEDHRKLAGSLKEEKPLKWQGIDIRNLSFTHHEGDEKLDTLRDIDLSIKAGQRIALVGTSGAGKSTLLTLLRGLYDVQRVDVDIDGAKYSSLAPLGSFTTLIPQDAEIFENTVRYNITFGLDIPEKLVNETLRITTFGDVAADLPEGVETDIRERGVNLSGGQKQRLAMARGLIAARDSSLLLLDEPTSSIDMDTESAIFNRLFEAFPDKTIIASVHRLHLLPRFDWIGIMQDGEIVQQGTFHDLTAAPGPFLTLWQQHLTNTTLDPAL